jgi:O-antigen ligase
LNRRRAPSKTASRALGVPLLDVVGVTLLLVFAGWILLVGAWTGRDPWPMASLVGACGVTAFASRSVTRRWNTLVPGLLLAVLMAAIVITWPEAIHRLFGLTGYSNANGALYVVGVGAACLVALRNRTRFVRLGAVAAGLTLATLPWAFAADAAAGNALLVLAVTAALFARDRTPRLLVPLSVLVAAFVLVATVAAGVLYTGNGDGDGAWQLTERRLVLWSDAVDLLSSHPVIGVGPGGFAQSSPTALSDRDARWAHHALLLVGAETGIPGLLLLLGVLGWAFAWLRQDGDHRGSALATVVLALTIAHASIDFIWHYAAVPTALAALVGAGATAGDCSLGPAPDRHHAGP